MSHRITSLPPPKPDPSELGEAHSAMFERLTWEYRKSARKMLLAVVTAVATAAGSYLWTHLQDAAAHDVLVTQLQTDVVEHAAAPGHQQTREALIRIEGRIDGIKTELLEINRRLGRIEGAVNGH